MRTGSAEMFASRRMASTRGLDETRQALSEAFLPVGFPAARSDDDVRMHLNALLVGRITCGFMRFRGAVRIETVEAQDYHVDIPMDGRSVMRAGAGAPVHASSTTAGAFVPGESVELDCSDDFAQLSVMIPRDLMQLEVEALLGRDDLAPVHFASEIDLSTPASRLVLQALQLIDGASDQASGPLAHPLALQRLEQVLLHSLLFGQPHNYSSELTGPAPKGGPRPLSQAVELLRRRPEHPWTVTELAAAVSTSARSLQEAFRRTLDTTPMAYLRRQRLERVREELLVAAPEAVSVTEVATRWGFIHLSRFAASYRATFSENPSDTLRS